ncbi:MAG: acyltransferase [bacterium]
MDKLRSVSSPPVAGPKLRLDSIDIFRGLAALSVALYHIWGHDGAYAFPSNGLVPQSTHIELFTYLISPLRWGYLGVSLFLVLSGFCIHLPYARKKYAQGNYTFEAKPFFSRRIRRLYPAYFVAVIGTAAIIKLVSFYPQFHVEEHFGIPTMWDVASHLTMLHGFIDSQFYSIASVFWSLSLEFQLYLAYPLFLNSFKKFGIGKSVIALINLCIVWRFVAVYAMGAGLISVAATGPYVPMGILPARMAEWLVGAYLAEVFARYYSANKANHPFKEKRTLLFIGSIIAFAIAIGTTFSQLTWAMTDPLFGLSFALLIAAVILPSIGVIRHASQRKLAKPFIQLGIVSYSFYLIHSQFGWIVAHFFPSQENAFGFLIIRLFFMLVSLVPIYYFYKFFEKPFLFPKARQTK